MLLRRKPPGFTFRLYAFFILGHKRSDLMSDKQLPQKYRSLARSQLEKAKRLIVGHDEDLLLTCLYLRQCIEALCYSLLTTYWQEVSSATVESWIPRQVLTELHVTDPMANLTSSITIEIPNPDPTAPPIVITGEDRRFSPKCENKAYNKLSNFLYVLTIKALEAQTTFPARNIPKQCEEYAEILSMVFETEIWNFVSGLFVKHECHCGFLIKRRIELIKETTIFECSECGRMYDVIAINNNIVEIVLRVAQWSCKYCDCNNQIGAHELKEGKEIRCHKCDEKATVGRAWTVS